MAVLYPYREQTARGVSSISLAPVAGRAYIVTRISVIGVAAPTFAEIVNGPTTVGYFSTGPAAVNHLAHPLDFTGGINIFDTFKSLGLPAEIPVVEGDTLQVSWNGNAALAKIEYREVDPGDAKPADPFGRESRDFPLVLYGTNDAAQPTTGYAALRDSLLPVQLTQFPYEILAEASRRYTIYGVLGLDVEESTGVAGQAWRTTALRATLERETLWDRSRVGFAMIGDGATDAGSERSIGAGINQIPFAGGGPTNGIFVLPTPLQVGPGEELIIEQGIEVDAGAGAGVGDFLVGLIARMMPAAAGGR